MPDADATTPNPPAQRPQFTLAALLAAVACVALELAYLEAFGPGALMVGVANLASGLAVGLAIGLLGGRPTECAFWAVIGNVFAYTAVVGAFREHWSADIFWPLVGACAGAAAGTARGPRPYRRMLLGAAAGAALSAAYAVVLHRIGATGLLIESACAVLAGGMMGGLVYVCLWIEEGLRLPRHLLACALVALAIAASWAGARLIPGW